MNQYKNYNIFLLYITSYYMTNYSLLHNITNGHYQPGPSPEINTTTSFYIICLFTPYIISTHVLVNKYLLYTYLKTLVNPLYDS